MAGARAYKVGTVFSRVNALIKSKAIKAKDSPLWFEVYKKFPPKFDPYYGRPAPDIEVKPIFYEEDVLRAKIYKKYFQIHEEVDLNSKQLTRSQKCINLYKNFVSEGISSEEAMKKAMEEVYESKSSYARSPPDT